MGLKENQILAKYFIPERKWVPQFDKDPVACRLLIFKILSYHYCTLHEGKKGHFVEIYHCLPFMSKPEGPIFIEGQSQEEATARAAYEWIKKYDPPEAI